jgi:hypothetical protein
LTLYSRAGCFGGEKVCVPNEIYQQFSDRPGHTLFTLDAGLPTH